MNTTTRRDQQVTRKPIDITGATNLLRSSRLALLAFAMLVSPLARAAESLPPKMYEVTTETGLPHLEDNLRYATTREQRCLSERDLSSAFPILSDVSLSGCKLDHESRHAHTVAYQLTCDGGHGTTGAAVWDLGADQIRGTLNVRLGGKNMTFYQRITAKPLGACVSAAK